MFLKHYIFLNLAASVFLYVNGETTSNETTNGECTLPSYPSNGKWVIIGGYDAKPGSTVPFNTIISFSCDEPYKISSDYSVIMCLGKDWNLRSPECSNSEKPDKVKRGIIITNNEYTSLDDDERRPNTYSRKRITINGGGGGGIVVESDGRRLEVNNRQDGSVNWNGRHVPDEANDEISIGRKGIIVGGNQGVILLESDGHTAGERGDGSTFGNKRIFVGGNDGEILLESEGRGKDGSTIGKKRISVGGNDGEILIESEGRGKDGSTIGKKRISVGANGGGVVIEREGQLGRQNEVLIGTGGRRVVVGPGEEGTIYVAPSGEVTRKWKGKTYYYNDEGQEGNGRSQSGGRAADGVVVTGGTVSGDVIGIGGSAYPTGPNNRYQERQGEYAQNERRIRSPASNKKKNKNANTGEDGEDGVVFDRGESIDGYVIGVGQPGQSGSQRGGKGGDGVVVGRGGRINGVVVGIGGQGGSGGLAGSNNKKQQKGEDEDEASPTTKKPKGQSTKGQSSKGQSSKSRIKRDPQQVLRFGLGVKIIQNSQGGILIQTTNDQSLSENGVNIPLGGAGGPGVSGLDPSKIRGVVVDVQGAHGNTHFARKRRDLEEKEENIEGEKEGTKDRKKRQLTIGGIPFTGQPIVVGGRGGDGLIIDGGVVNGNLVGTGGNGGNPTYRRKRNDASLREETEDEEKTLKENQRIKRSSDTNYLLKIANYPQNGTARDDNIGAKIRVKRREGRRGRGDQQGIMREYEDGFITLGGAEGGLIERIGNTERRLGTNDEGGIREILVNDDRGTSRGTDRARDRDRYPDIDIRGGQGSRDDDDEGRPSGGNGVRCPTLRNDDMVTVTCYNDRSRIVSCESATAGTSVEYKCANFYEPTTMKYQTGYCYDGEWTVSKPTCVPVCGKARLDATPQIVGGDPAAKGDYPWVAAIFQGNNNNFENVCGGSMLSQKVVLTAAHCVTNEFGDALSSNSIKVGVGKYYLGYRDPKDDEAQYSDVSQILVHKSYKGINQRFASDIAILITTDTLKLSRLAQPVCFEGLDKFQLVNQMRGWVTGWGFTLPGGPQAEVLKQLFVPYKDEATCRTEFPTEWLDDFLTYDKFCAGFFNRSVSVCRGDSGGGLVFRNTNGRFYVQGVVSLSMNTELKCQIQYSTLYTRVSTHYGWIREIMSLFG